MKKLYKDLERNTIPIGSVFGDLEVISYAGYEIKAMLNSNNKPYIARIHYWNTKCNNCGNESVIREDNLLSGNSKSCGCKRKIALQNYLEKVKSGELEVGSGEDANAYKHGWATEKLYSSYWTMKERCYNPNYKSYPRYGGNGIAVDPVWMGLNGFINFKEWSLANGYDPVKHSTLTLDRKNITGNFGPDNCQWITRSALDWRRQVATSNSNIRNNHIVTWAGLEYSVSELARHFGYDKDFLFYRLNKGNKSLAEAVLSPVWSKGKRGATERKEYIEKFGEFKENPNAINPFISCKYPDLINTNDPKLWYYSEDELATMRGISPVPQETEEEYQKAREIAKQNLINYLKNQKMEEN